LFNLERESTSGEDGEVLSLEYYFDTETAGIDPLEDKIITIQYQRLNGFTGEPIGDLEILKEWESSEEGIIRTFYPLLQCQNVFDFVPVGNNLLFDFHFLDVRSRKYGLPGFDLQCCHRHPFLDLKDILVLVNKGSFKGYSRIFDEGSLDQVDVPKLYEQRKYKQIVQYIKDENTFFLAVLGSLMQRCPRCKAALQTASRTD
jgi:hypothetical protein